MTFKQPKVKIIASIILLFLAAQIAGSILFRPKPAEAFFTDIPNFILNQAKWVWEKVAVPLYKRGAAVAFKNAVKTFTSKIAYDTAVWIGSGDQGQKPLLYTDDYGTYLRNAGDEAMGDFVQTLGKEYFGLNLCEPVSIDAKLKIILGLGKEIAPRKPLCTWKKMQEDWTNAVKDPNFLRNFSASFEPSQNELGVALTIESVAAERITKGKSNAILERINTWLKPVKSPIAKKTETPSGLSEEQMKVWVEKSLVAETTFTGDILADAISVFTNTLTANLMKRMAKGFWSLAGPDSSSSSQNLQDNYTFGGKKAAQAVFSSLAVPNIKSGGEYDYLNNFASCPEDTKYAAPDNCVIDEKFAQAVKDKLTVSEALEKGYLAGNFTLIPSSDIAKNQDPLCYNSAYCHNNLMKLRKARILPLGWEIAASISGGTATLQDAIDGFDVPTSPYYHLIDPNWVLKAPVTLCKAKVYGQLLESSESNRRQEVCVDTPSCINEDEDGNCDGNWGYCIREQNIWRLGGDSCPSYYNSCQTYTRRDGKTFSYLSNTLEQSGCNANNAGCAWYSKSKINNNWNIADKIYFNKNVEECDSKDAGCQEFLQFTNITNANQTIGDVYNLVQANAGAAYENYATVNKIYLNGNRTTCSVNELGCELYTPVSRQGEAAIPGIAAANDYCPSECAGYRSYIEMPTTFSPVGGFVSLIANSANKCSAQEVGCEEFTNLDEVAKGGEGKEYYSYLRQCQKPASTCADFYTWVGSDTNGYQLKVYPLKSSGGSPETTDSSGACCNPSNENCAEKIKNDPDCKEFYNESGQIFYRSYSKTISCSNDCHPLRKTISDAATCQNTGGVFTNGDCIYMAIPSQGIKCNSAGCREYKGNAGANYKIIINDDFESAANQGWSGVSSAESITVGGHSLSVNAAASKNNISFIKDKSYILSFWAKGGGSISGQIVTGASFGSINSSAADWNFYTLGPVNFNQENGVKTVTISGSGAFYLDNIILKEMTDSVYLIKNSWTTPNTCVQPISQINCEEYQDRSGATKYLKSFSKLCAENMVGCEYLVNTRNSTSPQAQTFFSGATSSLVGDCDDGICNSDETAISCPSDCGVVTVPADALEYVVNNSKNYCHSEDKGCKALGLPKLDINGQVVNNTWQTVYLNDDPDKYEISQNNGLPILCASADNSCEEFTSGAGNVYFKDPKDKACEYRKNVYVGNTLTTGWFQKGTNIVCNLNDANDAWAGLCQAEYHNCAAAKSYNEGTAVLSNNSYYKIENSNLTSCARESWKDGCVNFQIAKAGVFKDQPSATSDRLLSVARDRNCGQWIICESSHMVFDQNKGQYVEVCDESGLVLCDKTNEAGGATKCAHKVEDLNNPLTQKNYINFNTGVWNAMDFSGYALYNKYQMHLLSSVNVGAKDNPNYKLYRILENCSGSNGSACGGVGQCYNQKCLTTMEGTVPVLANLCQGGINQGKPCSMITAVTDCPGGVCNYSAENGLVNTCRGYPKNDAPFPAFTKNITEFAEANKCEDNNNCECSYLKVNYQSGDDKYYSVNNLAYPKNICQGGTKEGLACATYNEDVDTGCPEGMCSGVKKETKYLGWKGYCLEEDRSRTKNGRVDEFACLTWLAVDAIAGSSDLFNQYKSAGFDAGSLELGNGLYYCTATKPANVEWRIDHDKLSSCGGDCPGAKDFYTNSCNDKYDNCGAFTAYYKKTFYSPIGGEGCYIVNTATKLTYTKKQCETLQAGNICSSAVRVTDGNNSKAWTDRVWKPSGHTILNTTIDYDTACTPLFGALPKITDLTEIIFFPTIPTTTCKVVDGILLGAYAYTGNADLKNIFAKGYTAYNFDNNVWSISSNNPWDDTGNQIHSSKSPVIRGIKILSNGALACDIQTGKCEKSDNSQEYMTIRSQNSGDIIGKGGALPVNLKFFAWANKEQMPLKSIVVDWDDGASPINQGADNFYKNHLGDGECCDTEAGCSNFAHTPQACDEAYFSYSKTYSCNGSGDNWDPSYGQTGACIFRPRVTIKDNWGWCNNGGYDGSATNPCGGQEFSGRIIVIP